MPVTNIDTALNWNCAFCQVENEYGDYAACDKKYMEYLLTLSRSLLKDDVVYFTLSGMSSTVETLHCGTVNGTLNTLDFGVGKL